MDKKTSRGKFDHKFSKYLSNLKDERESSDYEIYSGVDSETAKLAVKEAEEFFAAAEHYLKKLMV